MPTTFTDVWGVDQWSEAVSESLIRQSALLAAVRPISVNGKVFYKPRLSVHPTASWVAELATLPTDAGTEDVIEYTPRKIGNSTTLSTESIEDSTDDVLNTFGDALARGLSHEIDATALTASAATATAPAGLLNGLTAITPEAETAFGLDDIYNGVSAIETVGGNADVAFINGADINALRKTKTTTGQYIWLQDNSVTGDPGAVPTDTFAGVKFYISPGIAQGTMLIADSAFISVVSNRSVSVQFDPSAAFLEDGVAAKVTYRVDWAVEDPNAVYLLQTT